MLRGTTMHFLLFILAVSRFCVAEHQVGDYFVSRAGRYGLSCGGDDTRDETFTELDQFAWDAVEKVNAISEFKVVPVKIIEAISVTSITDSMVNSGNVLKAKNNVSVGIINSLTVEYGQANCSNAKTARDCVLVENGPLELYKVTVTQFTITQSQLETRIKQEITVRKEER